MSTMSPANSSLALFWLNNCIKLHRPCQQFQIRDTLPTRIIDVSDPYHPLLVDGENRSCQYNDTADHVEQPSVESILVPLGEPLPTVCITPVAVAAILSTPH
jgi:hypothetical protein